MKLILRQALIGIICSSLLSCYGLQQDLATALTKALSNEKAQYALFSGRAQKLDSYYKEEEKKNPYHRNIRREDATGLLIRWIESLENLNDTLYSIQNSSELEALEDAPEVSAYRDYFKLELEEIFYTRVLATTLWVTNKNHLIYKANYQELFPNDSFYADNFPILLFDLLEEKAGLLSYNFERLRHIYFLIFNERIPSDFPQIEIYIDTISQAFGGGPSCCRY